MNYRITLDLGTLGQAVTDEAMARAFPAIAHVVGAVAEGVRVQWQEQVYRLAPPYCRNEAVDSIKVSDLSPLHKVVSSDSQAVRYIEEGTPARDLKKMLRTSSKTKVSSQGKRYLTIPMRHNTPGQTAHAPAMPQAIHAQAKNLAPSRITGRTMRANADGLPTARNKYLWGDRLPAGLAGKLKPSHKSDPFAGMVRMSTGSGKQRSSAYFTFRTMTADSSGWIIPAKPGLFVLRDIVAKAQGHFADAISRAIAAAGV